MREQVAHQVDPEATQFAYATADEAANAKHLSIDRRVGKLEERQSVLESRMAGRVETINGLLALMEQELQVLVTRPELDHVRWIVYGISLSMISGGTFALVFKLVGK